MRPIALFCSLFVLAHAGYAFKPLGGYTPPGPYVIANTDTFPVITCPSDTVLIAGPTECSVSYPYLVTVSDDHPGWTLTQTAGLPPGAAFPLVSTLNQFTATDVDGNSATCSFTVTVKDYTPPVMLCKQSVPVTLGSSGDPDDCYGGQVIWIPAAAFDNGSYDNCNNVKLTVRRPPPFSACLIGLNSLNGHPDCNDNFPDFPSEFERALSEQDSMKFYCCEAGTQYYIEMRAYQLRPNGGIAIGPDGKPIYGACQVLVQIDTATCVFENQSVYGTVRLDANKNCLVDDPQISTAGLIVQAIRSGGDTLYATTNATGYYTFTNLDAGTYTFNVIPPSPLWTTCNGPAALTVAPTGMDIQQNFLIQATIECPLMFVDMGTALMRPCSTSVWTAQYCNLGDQTAEDAVLQILPDSQLAVSDVSFPYTMNGDTVVVALGDVQAGTCQSVQISLDVPCDPSISGDNLCVEAHIFPDTVCIPPSGNWSGAQIEARATCDGDSVRFTLRNAGIAPTSGILGYIVIDDMVIMRQGELPAGFAPGEEQHESVYASGHLMRLRAEQESNHPLAPNPSLAVENCNGFSMPALFWAFANEDGNPFTDLECQVVVNSYDPNEKLAFPTGYDDAHYLEPNTPLTYQLNFQNTGTDTAFLIVLRDTLSALLDPASIRMGASSHPYTWTLSGNGELMVRFANIRLPDSTTNEPASHGFVRFEIAQKRDNAIGSVIENRAGIYFDINPVVLTNTVFHTVGNNFIPITATQEPSTGLLIRVYPNPATGDVFVPLSSETPVQVILRDMLGCPLRRCSGQSPGVAIPRAGLPDGIYWLEFQLPSGQRQSGLVVWTGRER